MWLASCSRAGLSLLGAARGPLPRPRCPVRRAGRRSGGRRSRRGRWRRSGLCPAVRPSVGVRPHVQFRTVGVGEQGGGRAAHRLDQLAVRGQFRTCDRALVAPGDCAVDVVPRPGPSSRCRPPASAGTGPGPGRHRSGRTARPAHSVVAPVRASAPGSPSRPGGWPVLRVRTGVWCSAALRPSGSARPGSGDAVPVRGEGDGCRHQLLLDLGCGRIPDGEGLAGIREAGRDPPVGVAAHQDQAGTPEQ